MRHKFHYPLIGIYLEDTVPIFAVICHMVSIFQCFEWENICYSLWMIPNFNFSKPSFFCYLYMACIAVKLKRVFNLVNLCEQVGIIKNVNIVLTIDKEACAPIQTWEILMVKIAQLIFFFILHIRFDQLSVNLTLLHILSWACLYIMSFFSTVVTGNFTQIFWLSKSDFCHFRFIVFFHRYFCLF